MRRLTLLLVLGLAWTAGCARREKSSHVPPAASSAPSPSSVSSSIPRTEVSGPRRVSLTAPSPQPLVYSSDGRWSALATKLGVLLLDSQHLVPVAFAALAGKGHLLTTFRPGSPELFVLDEAGLAVLAIEGEDGRFALRVREAWPLYTTPNRLVPAFDRTGQHLAVFDAEGAVLYDVDKKTPRARLSSEHPVDAGGFSVQILYLVAASTATTPRSLFSAFSLDGATAEKRSVAFELRSPLFLRQGKLVCPAGLFDLNQGQRLLAFDDFSEISSVFRLREQKASLLRARAKDGADEIWVLTDTGKRRRLGTLPSSAGPLAARPQDDWVEVLDGPPLGQIRVLRFGLGSNQQDPVELPRELCVEDSRVVPSEACGASEERMQVSAFPSAAPFASSLPQLPSTARTTPRSTPPRNKRLKCTREGENDCIW